jgi:hypothetical protein
MSSLFLLRFIPARPECQMELIVPFLEEFLDVESMMDKHVGSRSDLFSVLLVSGLAHFFLFQSMEHTTEISQKVSSPSNTKSACGSDNCSFETLKVVLKAQSASPTPTISTDYTAVIGNMEVHCTAHSLRALNGSGILPSLFNSTWV